MVFLYSELVKTVAKNLPSGAINLGGGRFTGKSSFVSQLEDHLKRYGRRVVVLKGRNPCPTGLPLRGIGALHADVEYILIDDLDRLLLPEQELSSSKSDEVARLRDTILDLAELTESEGRNGERKSKLLVTTTGRFFNLLNPRRSYQRILLSLPKDLRTAYSRLETRFHFVHLNPWDGEWQSAWNQAFNREFENELRTPIQLKVWGDMISDVTGGHPALFGPVLENLRAAIEHYRRKPTEFPQIYGRLFADRAARAQDAANTVRSERLIRAKVEEWIEDDGIHPLSRTLRRLRDSTDPLELDAFRELVRIAAEKNAGPPEDRFVRDLLQFEDAVAYKDAATGNYLIPGSYLRTIIRRASFGVQIVRVETDPQVAHRGVVHVQTSAGEKTIRLSLGKWRLFKMLFEKSGELVTLTEIEQRTKMSKRAVQNVVARMRQQELREVNLEITNERDRGYRLVVPSSRS